MFRRVAWRLQALSEGDLSQRARDRATALAVVEIAFERQAPELREGTVEKDFVTNVVVGKSLDSCKRLPQRCIVLRPLKLQLALKEEADEKDEGVATNMVYSGFRCAQLLPTLTDLVFLRGSLRLRDCICYCGALLDCVNKT